MADYFESTQYKLWTFTKEALVKNRPNADEYPEIRLFLYDQLVLLSTRLSVRQRVVSTAQVYISRVLTRIKLAEINPYLLMATALYVACRSEEQPVHIRTVSLEARNLWPDYMPVESWQLAECEFYVLAELETCLLVHHPYEPLLKLAEPLGLASAEIQACWAAINDVYATDVPLIYAPSVIAYTAVYMVLVLKPALIPNRQAKQVKVRLDALSHVMGSDKQLDLRALVGCVQELLSLYTLKSSYDPAAASKKVKDLL